MPFETYSKRMKLLSASGQADVYQYDNFPVAFRVQAVYIIRAAIGEYVSNISADRRTWQGRFVSNMDWKVIHDILAEEEGVFSLTDRSANPQASVTQRLLTGSASQVLDTIELTFRFINGVIRRTLGERYNDSSPITRLPDDAISDLNARFREHNIGFEYFEGELIRKDSEYLHEETVKPALSLLNDSNFSGPQDEFLRAHAHLRAGEYQDAIVDANNAFESTMKAICNLRRWTYDEKATAKDLNNIMFDKALIPVYLTSHFDHLRLVLEAGLPTVRNKTSTHGQGSVPVAIPEYLAAYAMHLAAANIVLLVEAYKANQ